MSDEPHARLLSGEILTADAPVMRAAFAEGEVIDADYVTLEPQTRPGRRDFSPIPAAPVVTLAGMDMLRKNDAAPPAAASPGSAGFWLFGLALAAGAFWISGGHVLVGR